MSGLQKWMMDAWVESCGLDPSSERTLYYGIRMFDGYLAKRGVRFDETSRTDVLGFLFWLEKEHAPSVAYGVLGVVKRFYSWAEKEGFHLDVAKEINVEDYSRTSGTRIPITPLQVEELLDSCASPRERAVVALVCLAMVKPSEINGVLTSQVRLGDGTPRIVLRRGIVYLTDRCAKILEAYLAERNPEMHEYLFESESNKTYGAPLSVRSIRQVIQGVFARTPIPGLPANYNLGASAVVMAAKSGADPVILMEMAVRYGRTLPKKGDFQEPSYLLD